MTNDIQLLIEVLFAAATGVLGFIVNGFQNRIKALESARIEHEKEIASLLAGRQDNARQFEEIKALLNDMRKEMRDDLNRMWSRIDKN